jgi:uncharacterized glyoxalase superfamily protein PhnB
VELASIRLVTKDLERLTTFYTLLTGTAATRLHPEFAEIRLKGTVLALSTEVPIQQFNAGAAIAAANRSAIFEFQVEDVDGVHKRMSGAAECVMEPTTMPWGNRSLLLRDPDGNLVNIFSKPMF